MGRAVTAISHRGRDSDGIQSDRERAARTPSLFDEWDYIATKKLAKIEQKLRDVPLPSEPTETQVEAAEKLAPTVHGIRLLVENEVRLSCGMGLTPKEFTDLWSFDIVTVRARFTELLQSGRLVRIPVRRRNQLVHVHKDHWQHRMGSVPSKRHKGQPR